MNLLAHLHLSEGRPAGVAAGNLLADYLRRLDAAPLDADFAAGVHLHRAIDAYADSHPVLRAVRTTFAPPWRRWSGILLDVACDFFLTRDWARYAARPLRDHVDARLDEIQRHLQARSAPLATLVERLRAEEWLLSYGSLDGLRGAFERIARHSPAAAVLRGAEREIERRQPELPAAFDEFYPRLRARCGAGQPSPASSP